ncbi:MAG: hypothetical protein FWH55_13430, partial [Oscillospiraceae bacterium]|nr:hypothetical protein [Oscillospiraceae bacterium]
MATYQGITGNTYSTITPALGVGTEGEVFALQGNANLVAKIFKSHCRTDARRRKLETMIGSPFPLSAMQQVTWPTDVLFANGDFAGYVEIKLNQNTSLSEIHVPMGKFKDLRFSDRISIASSLCVAINAVHNAGQVCGDLNPHNIVVDPINKKIVLVNTDSYHITANDGRIFRCTIALGEYLPAEIQHIITGGFTLDNAPLPTFSKESDFFAMAIHIFRLLMNGCHPYSSAVSDSAFQQMPCDSIGSGFTPFFQCAPHLSTPSFAPPITSLPPTIQELFYKAFVLGHQSPISRPSTVEWYHALEYMKTQLTVCVKKKNHQYSS